MADSGDAGQRSYKDRRADKKTRPELKNLQLNDDSEPEGDANDGDYADPWESMKTASGMAPPTRQSSRRPSATTDEAPTRQSSRRPSATDTAQTRQSSSRRPSAAGTDETSKPTSSTTNYTRKPSASAASHTHKPSSSTPAHARNPSSSNIKVPPTNQLPPGVTREMVIANLDRIERDRARQEQLRTSQPRPDLQVDINPETLPCALSVFCNIHTVTRELLFNISRLDSIAAIKSILNSHFAYEFKRIGLPKDIYFAGINVVYEKSSNKEDWQTFGTFVTDGESQLAVGDIMDETFGKTTTGQLVRVQVMLYTDDQLAAEQPRVKEMFAAGEYDVMQSINGMKWLLEGEDVEKLKIDTRIFEVDQDERGTITAPVRTWRENEAKAERGDIVTANLSEAYKAKANIRNKEYDIRKEMIAENRGLRRWLRKETGISNIQLEEVLEYARDAEETEGRGRVQFAGEKQDWERIKELRKEVEEKSDQYNAAEGRAFDHAFGRI